VAFTFGQAFRAALAALRSRTGTNPGDYVTVQADGTLPGVQGHRGGFYISTPAGTVLAPGAAKLAGTSTAAGTLNGFTHSNGRLTFDGPGTFEGLATVDITVDVNVLATVSVFLAKNGVPVTPSTIERKVSPGEPGALSITFPVTLTAGDFVEVWGDASAALTLTAQKMLVSVYSTIGAKGSQGPAGPPGGINLFAQATRPTTAQIPLGSLGLWKDTNTGKRFVVFNADNVVDAVEGT